MVRRGGESYPLLGRIPPEPQRTTFDKQSRIWAVILVVVDEQIQTGRSIRASGQESCRTAFHRV